MQATRQQILDFLRERGEARVLELGGLLELTPTGVRQHLNTLEREGLVTSREVRGRVGRPALVYRLTAEAEALYPKAYDRLALAMLSAARTRLSEDDFSALLQEAATHLAEPLGGRAESGDPTTRVETLCTVLREQDIVVEAERVTGGYLLTQRTCPFHDAAEATPATCDLDAAYLGALTQLPVVLVESRARGGSACTFRIESRVEPHVQDVG